MNVVSLVPPQPLPGQGQDAAILFALERPQDAPLAEDLVERAFGPGRYAKAAERLREGNRLRADLSVCAWDGDALAGCVRQWPILIGETRAIFLGPIAVDPAYRHHGLGGELIRRACALAVEAGERLVLLVGDQAFFVPLGFEPVPQGRVSLPGPAHPQRILWRPLVPGALDGAAGPVRIPPRS